MGWCDDGTWYARSAEMLGVGKARHQGMAVSIDWYGFRVVSWIGQAIVGLAAIRRGLRGDWKGGIALAGVASSSFVFTARQKSLPLLFDLLFPIGALLNAAGWVWKLFRKPGPYDEITHGFTIFSITLALNAPKQIMQHGPGGPPLWSGRVRTDCRCEGGRRRA